MTADDTPAPQDTGSTGLNFSFSTFLSHGFRPFFLAAGIYAMLAMGAWLAWIGIHAMGAMPAAMSVAEPLHLWHAHEMVFGFAAAAVSGFLLTAVPNWTGAPHSKGRNLFLMFAIWCAGRIAMWGTALLPPVLPLILDVAFLPVLGIAAARQLAVKPALRNVVFLLIIVAMTAANLLYHLGRMGLIGEGMRMGVLFGLGTLIVMITVIGGRVIPGFTTNALRRLGIEENRLPVRRPRVGMACLILTATVFLLLGLGANQQLVGLGALAAALAHAIRLAGWRGQETLGDPIVWVLHLGYGWIVVGFTLLAAALLLGWGSQVSALHAFGTGAVATMTLAIMSRAALGHTGRALKAPPFLVAAYVLVSIAALLRCFGPGAAPQLYNEIMLAAGLIWIAAFASYMVVFAPILLGPRLARGG